MLGVLVTVLSVAAAAVTVLALAAGRLKDLDPAERFGTAGLLGLGAIGTLTFFLGLVPGGLALALPLFTLVLVVGIATAYRRGVFPGLRCERPTGVGLIAVAALALMALVPLVAVLAPSDARDWDSLAYHLAVPKLWIQAGQITWVPALHQSNFPFVVDNLYILGLQRGGEAAAKAYSWCFLLLGLFALFGTARRWGAARGAWWAPLAFAGAPVVLWGAGTAYIDVAHGLFAGLGVLYAAEWLWREREERGPFLILSALFVGLACASKYTGLQVMAAVALVLAVGGFVRRERAVGCRGAVVVGAVALLVASPWLVRNIVNTGNPVYPFFYSVFGGRDWDAWRAALYTDEQQTFGVGRTATGRDVTQIGHAVLGLAYQPGRYVNPGQTEGAGFPTGAIGFAALLAGFLLAASGRAGAREKTVLATVGVLLVTWFFLSQQSRYLTLLVVPLSVLASVAVLRLRWGPVVLAAVSAQALYTVGMLWTTQTRGQLPVALGQVDRKEHLRRAVPFFASAESLNQLPKGSKVALYHEVFGFFLDVPYMWANPGHSTLIPYERLETGHDYAEAMQGLGFTHVYVNLAYESEESLDRWLGAMGGRPWTAEEAAPMDRDLNLKWMRLLADAVSAGRLRGVQTFRRSVLFEFVPEPRR